MDRFNNFDNYIDVYTEFYKELRKNKIPFLMEKNIKSGYHRYKKVFDESKLYMLDCDLFFNGSIEKIECMAPMEFAYVRTIIIKLLSTEISQECLDILINNVPNNFNKFKFLNALFIDACFVLELFLLQRDIYFEEINGVMKIIDLIENSLIWEEMNGYDYGYRYVKMKKLI